MKKYFYLYLRFAKSGFSLGSFLGVPLLSLLLAGFFSTDWKTLSSNTTVKGDYGMAYFEFLNYLLTPLRLLFEYFDFSLPFFIVTSLALYIVVFYMIVMLVLFILVELRYFKYRRKGHSTKEIQELLRRDNAKKIIGDKDDY